MDLKLIPAEDFKKLLESQDAINTKLDQLLKTKDHPLGDPIIDLVDFCNMLHISKRKAYDLRMNGEIDYIQEPGSAKIFFRASAINAYLNKHHNKAFKK